VATTSLKAIAALGDGTVKKTDLFRVDPRVLQEEAGFNLRNYDDPDVIERIEAFANAYATGQYVPPIMVRVSDDSEIILVEGHQRRRGALLAIERGAEIAYLDAVQFRGNDAERVEVMLRSAEGLRLKPLEVALGYLRLQRMGYEIADIAKKMSKSTSHVDQMLVLAVANHDVHAMVRNGSVAAHVAVDAVVKHGEKAGAFLAGKLDKVKSEGKTKVTARHMSGPKVPPKVVARVVDRFKAIAPIFEANADLAKTVEVEGIESLQGKQVTLDATQFYELMQANAEIVASLTKETKAVKPPKANKATK